MIEERRLERVEPINGRFGYALNVIRQVQPTLLVLLALFMIFGFQFSTPGQKIAEFDLRLQHLERAVEALVRYTCVTAEPQAAKLSNLPCSEMGR